jgi:hypothetical protein
MNTEATVTALMDVANRLAYSRSKDERADGHELALLVLSLDFALRRGVRLPDRWRAEETASV